MKSSQLCRILLFVNKSVRDYERHIFIYVYFLALKFSVVSNTFVSTAEQDVVELCSQISDEESSQKLSKDSVGSTFHHAR